MSAPAAHHANRLIHEKSPYLLQHAHNAVDWYPWGDEAFDRARQENKPVLVSIGYSTCHWCHVMERESYEDSTIADLMNRYLVNIKVDREERPDVDKIYMTAVSAMTGSGGWPLNVFLTPDRQPFFGGTYFPPYARGSHPGWAEIVEKIGQAWSDPTTRKQIVEIGRNLTDTLKTSSATSSDPQVLKAEWLEGGFAALRDRFDSVRGGFSPAPKFPMPGYLSFLLRYAARGTSQHRDEALQMLMQTLRKMSQGGIYDHLGGGFARYSTDASWHVPHFEKMLYDNAQLAVVYLEAYQLTREDRFRQVARGTLDYVRRDLCHPEGAFYSAEDADSLEGSASEHITEGAYYVWTKSDIASVLGREEADLFSFRYGVRDEGNVVHDPHGDFINKNILHEAHSVPDTARQFDLPPGHVEAQLSLSCNRLFQSRLQRPRPHRDDKVLSSWNGLMISAFAKAYQVLGQPQDLQSAVHAARFLKSHLYDPASKVLYRRWREGERKVHGIADDYAFVIQGLLDLYESDFDASWIEWAIELQGILNERFFDFERGGYFMTEPEHDPHLLLRVKEDLDNVEPSASSIAALNGLRLSHYTGTHEYREIALKTLAGAGCSMSESPAGHPVMLIALDWALTEPCQIILAGSGESEEIRCLLQVVYRHFLPGRILIVQNPRNKTARFAKELSFLESLTPIDGKATAFVCFQQTCRQPTTNPQVLEEILRAMSVS